MMACAYGHLDVVKYLLESDELNEHTNIYYETDNWNALMCACSKRYLNIVEYLLIEHNFQINSCTHDWLIENEHQKVLDMIKIRDLYQKINNELLNHNPVMKNRKF